MVDISKIIGEVFDQFVDTEAGKRQSIKKSEVKKLYQSFVKDARELAIAGGTMEAVGGKLKNSSFESNDVEQLCTTLDQKIKKVSVEKAQDFYINRLFHVYSETFRGFPQQIQQKKVLILRYLREFVDSFFLSAEKGIVPAREALFNMYYDPKLKISAEDLQKFVTKMQHNLSQQYHGKFLMLQGQVGPELIIGPVFEPMAQAMVDSLAVTKVGVGSDLGRARAEKMTRHGGGSDSNEDSVWNRSYALTDSVRLLLPNDPPGSMVEKGYIEVFQGLLEAIRSMQIPDTVGGTTGRPLTAEERLDCITKILDALEVRFPLLRNSHNQLKVIISELLEGSKQKFLQESATHFKNWDVMQTSAGDLFDELVKRVHYEHDKSQEVKPFLNSYILSKLVNQEQIEVIRDKLKVLLRQYQQPLSQQPLSVEQAERFVQDFVTQAYSSLGLQGIEQRQEEVINELNQTAREFIQEQQKIREDNQRQEEYQPSIQAEVQQKQVQPEEGVSVEQVVQKKPQQHDPVLPPEENIQRLTPVEQVRHKVGDHVMGGEGARKSFLVMNEGELTQYEGQLFSAIAEYENPLEILEGYKKTLTPEEQPKFQEIEPAVKAQLEYQAIQEKMKELQEMQRVHEAWELFSQKVGALVVQDTGKLMEFILEIDDFEKRISEQDITEAMNEKTKQELVQKLEGYKQNVIQLREAKLALLSEGIEDQYPGVCQAFQAIFNDRGTREQFIEQLKQSRDTESVLANDQNAELVTERLAKILPYQTMKNILDASRKIDGENPARTGNLAKLKNFFAKIYNGMRNLIRKMSGAKEESNQRILALLAKINTLTTSHFTQREISKLIKRVAQKGQSKE